MTTRRGTRRGRRGGIAHAGRARTAAEPAAVDTDQDSYLDTIFIGNTAGYLYKVDLSEAPELEENVKVNDYSCGSSTPCVRTVDRITDSRWEPFPIFYTGSRPIYYAPSVIFVPELARFAIRRLLPRRERAAALEAQIGDVAETRERLAERLEAQQQQFEELRGRARTQLASRGAQGEVADLLGGPGVDDAEVELELLRRRTAGQEAQR